MFDRSILAGRVHGLEDHQQRPPILGGQNVLQARQFLHAFCEQLSRLRFALGFKSVRVARIVILQSEVFSFLDPVALEHLFYFHG